MGFVSLTPTYGLLFLTSPISISKRTLVGVSAANPNVHVPDAAATPFSIALLPEREVLWFVSLTPTYRLLFLA